MGDWQKALTEMKEEIQKLGRLSAMEKTMQIMQEQLTKLIQRSEGTGNQDSESLLEERNRRRFENEPTVTTRDYLPRRLELPIFFGDDVEGWVFRVERYFSVNHLSEKEKIEAATVCFEGAALSWFQWENKNQPFQTWTELKQFLTERFRLMTEGSNRDRLLTQKQEESVEGEQFFGDFMEEKHWVKKQFLLDESDLLNEKRGGDTNLSPLTEESLIGQALNSKESLSVIASDQTIEEFFQPEEQQRQEEGQKPTNEHREWRSLWKVVSCCSVFCHNPQTGHTVEGSGWASEFALKDFLDSELSPAEDERLLKVKSSFKLSSTEKLRSAKRDHKQQTASHSDKGPARKRNIATIKSHRGKKTKKLIQVKTPERMKMAANGRGVKKKPMTVGEKQKQRQIKAPDNLRLAEDYCGWEKEQMGMKLRGRAGIWTVFVNDGLFGFILWAGFLNNMQRRKLDDKFYGREKE